MKIVSMEYSMSGQTLDDKNLNARANTTNIIDTKMKDKLLYDCLRLNINHTCTEINGLFRNG